MHGDHVSGPEFRQYVGIYNEKSNSYYTSRTPYKSCAGVYNVGLTRKTTITYLNDLSPSNQVWLTLAQRAWGKDLTHSTVQYVSSRYGIAMKKDTPPPLSYEHRNGMFANIDSITPNDAVDMHYIGNQLCVYLLNVYGRQLWERGVVKVTCYWLKHNVNEHGMTSANPSSEEANHKHETQTVYKPVILADTLINADEGRGVAYRTQLRHLNIEDLVVNMHPTSSVKIPRKKFVDAIARHSVSSGRVCARCSMAAGDQLVFNRYLTGSSYIARLHSYQELLSETCTKEVLDEVLERGGVTANFATTTDSEESSSALLKLLRCGFGELAAVGMDALYTLGVIAPVTAWRRNAGKAKLGKSRAWTKVLKQLHDSSTNSDNHPKEQEDILDSQIMKQGAVYSRYVDVARANVTYWARQVHNQLEGSLRNHLRHEVAKVLCQLNPFRCNSKSSIAYLTIVEIAFPAAGGGREPQYVAELHPEVPRNIRTEKALMMTQLHNANPHPGLELQWADMVSEKVQTPIRQATIGEGGAVSWPALPSDIIIKAWPRSVDHLYVCLSKLYPASSKIDATHYTLKLASIISLANKATYKSRIPTADKTISDIFTEDYKGVRPLLVKMAKLVFRCVPIGAPSQRALIFLLNGMNGASSAYAVKCLVNGTCNGPIGTVTKRLKHLSNMGRQLSWLPGSGTLSQDEVAASAYAELSSGRGLNKSDWAQEIKNRCTATGHVGIVREDRLGMWVPGQKVGMSEDGNSDAVTEYYAKLRSTLRPLLSKLMNAQTVKDEALEQFWLRRHEWVTAGSASGVTLSHLKPDRFTNSTDEAGKPLNRTKLAKLAKIRVSKRVWADHTSYKQIRQVLEGIPEEVAGASEKYENGKSRAIYGVGPMHYTINSYATAGLEGRMHLLEGCEKGKEGVGQFLVEQYKCRQTNDVEYECSMFDYADFNIQHTPKSQAIIFEEMARIARHQGYHKDKIDAFDWLAKAKYNMRFTVPGDSKEYHVKQGMFSGTRSTDFINTLLNLCYFKIARAEVYRKYGVSPVDLYNVHQGDDVWISNKNALWARLVYYELNNQGFVFQLNKQMFGPGRGEFLRTLYHDGQASGYLNRMLANYILRPVQNDQIDDVFQAASMFRSSFDILHKRKMDDRITRLLWLDMVHHWMVVRAQSDEGRDKKPWRVPTPLLLAPSSVGGLAVPPPGFSTYGVDGATTLSAMPQVNWAVSSELRSMEGEATSDWIKYVSPTAYSRYKKMKIKTMAIRDVSHASNYYALARASSYVQGKARYKQDMALWAAGQTHVMNKLRRDSQHILGGETLQQCNDIKEVVSYLNKCPVLPSMGVSETASSIQQARWELSPPLRQPHLRTGAFRLGRLSKNIAKFETKGVFKSVDVTATALGLSKVEALKTMATMDTSNQFVNDEMQAFVAHAATKTSTDFIDYMLQRKVGLELAFGPFLSMSSMNIIHSLCCDLMLAKGVAKAGKAGSWVASCDVGVVRAVASGLKKQLALLENSAY